MDTDKLVRIDGIKWLSGLKTNVRGKEIKEVHAICPIHSMELTPTSSKHSISVNGNSTVSWSDGQYLHCDEGHVYEMPRIYSQERLYVRKRLDAVNYSKMKTLNLDDEAVPIAKERLSSDDDKYFVTSQLMKSKRGIQLVIYAGEKGKKEKAQIFIEPEIRRLAFDQNDLHPSDVFLTLSAIFDDGSRHEISSS